MKRLFDALKRIKLRRENRLFSNSWAATQNVTPQAAFNVDDPEGPLVRPYSQSNYPGIADDKSKRTYAPAQKYTPIIEQRGKQIKYPYDSADARRLAPLTDSQQYFLQAKELPQTRSSLQFIHGVRLPSTIVDGRNMPMHGFYPQVDVQTRTPLIGQAPLRTIVQPQAQKKVKSKYQPKNAPYKSVAPKRKKS